MGGFFSDKTTLATTLNSRILAATHIAPVVLSVNTVRPTSQIKLPCSYPETVSYPHKKDANHQRIASVDFTNSRNKEHTNITLIPCANDIYANLWKMASVFNESTLNEIFIDRVEPIICHSFREYWAIIPHVDVISIAFKSQLLLAILKRSPKQSSSGSCVAPLKPSARRNWNKSSVSII